MFKAMIFTENIPFMFHFRNTQRYLDIHKPDISLHKWKFPLSGPSIILMSIFVFILYSPFTVTQLIELLHQVITLLQDYGLAFSIFKPYTLHNVLPFQYIV